MALFTLSRITGRYMAGFRSRQLRRHVVEWNHLDEDHRWVEAAAAILDADVRQEAREQGVELPGPKDVRVFVTAGQSGQDTGTLGALLSQVSDRVYTRWTKFVAWYSANAQLAVRRQCGACCFLSCLSMHASLTHARSLALSLSPSLACWFGLRGAVCVAAFVAVVARQRPCRPRFASSFCAERC